MWNLLKNKNSETETLQILNDIALIYHSLSKNLLELYYQTAS